MKVLYISEAYTPHDYRFIQTAQSFGHEVHHLMLTQRPDLEKRDHPEGVSIHRLSTNYPPSLFSLPRAYRGFNQVLHQVDPTLIHAGPVYTGAFLPALRGFHPLVAMSWGSDLLLEAVAGWKKQVATYTLRRSDVVICDCTTVQKAVMKLGVEKSKITQFPWGVDLERFHPEIPSQVRTELGWDTQFVLLSTRSLERLYGVDNVVDAFIQVASEDTSICLLMVGSGSLQEDLEDRVRMAGLMDRVYFQGQTENAELPQYYCAADVYISASHSDGSSVSLLEAMACGRPVLVSDIDANKEWVIPGMNGWWFKDGDVSSLADSIRKARSVQDDLIEIGQSGREVVEIRADWSRNKLLLEQAYQQAARPDASGRST